VTDTDISDSILPDGWSEIDSKAIDTIRVLAAEAVQNVGNGHPGTAMSLAPVAYLLFQKVMRHNPSDTHWPGRDRFVLSCGHTSLTLYIQLYLGGFGLELDDIRAYRFWGSKTPGHPDYLIQTLRGARQYSIITSTVWPQMATSPKASLPRLPRWQLPNGLVISP
jgi:transketolase